MKRISHSSFELNAQPIKLKFWETSFLTLRHISRGCPLSFTTLLFKGLSTLHAMKKRCQTIGSHFNKNAQSFRSETEILYLRTLKFEFPRGETGNFTNIFLRTSGMLKYFLYWMKNLQITNNKSSNSATSMAKMSLNRFSHTFIQFSSYNLQICSTIL